MNTDGFPIQRPHMLPTLPKNQQWLIDGLWAYQAVGIIGGEPKSCKSFLALGMAVAVASGKDCLGKHRVPSKGTVLLFAAEDALHIVRKRLEGICAYHQLLIENLDLWVITAPAIRLDNKEDQRRLEQTVEAIKPTLLVLDPFVRLHRIDENLSAAVAPLLAFLRELQRNHGCAIALVHHTKKGGAALRAGQALRGSSEFHAWGDSNLYLRRIKKQLLLTIEHRAQHSISGVPLELQCSDSKTALIVEQHQQLSHTSEQQLILKTDGERVLEALADFDKPVRARQLREVCRMRSEALLNNLKTLTNTGQIIRENDGWRLA